ncbi:MULTISPECIES: methyltransferase domain-containing protein [Streptomyces]|uniref:SAM-dependent methyltransferase n=1 Tax=Streptomyces venezuelae TaxID=54571 RepID=A0A5P2B287_STRVZ|nr:methyltransferase domain-containing protein [Streptomyces venezuelae]QES23858.1 SAM-dependent methyltransferase [Streptomyces venezuelae]
MTDFAAVGSAYAAHSRTGRGRLRHDLVARRLLAELPAGPVRVLDAGCGDGEMTLRIAAAGHHVTAADPSAEMLGAAARRLAARPELAPRVRLLEAGVEDLFFDGGLFDAVCCHGVLMYLDDTPGSVALLAGLVAPGGVLSILTKNREAIGFREALRGDCPAARRLIAYGCDTSVGNLGLDTRGDTAETLDRLAAEHGLTPLDWQGVRIFHDHLAGWDPAPSAYAQALETEWVASSRDPYRRLGRLVHTLARRLPGGDEL